MSDVVRFLTDHLRPGRDWTIAEEYPLAITETNRHNVRIMRDDEGFISATVMKPLTLRSPAGLFRVAAIGSVVTNPERRNQGHSRQTLNAALEAAAATGCEFAILWTDLADFYRKLGFELGGSEVAVTIPRALPVGRDEAADLRFVAGSQVDPAAILRVYAQHTAGSVRTAEDIRRYLSIPNARVYTAWDPNNQLQAYAVEGKGADLDGYVHEWGGGVSKLIPLLRHVAHARARDVTLIAPPHAGNLIRRLKELGARDHGGVLGMIKILNPAGLLAKVQKFARAMGATDVILDARADGFYLGAGDVLFRTDQETDLVKLIFGPLPASRLNAFDARTAAEMERALPIPLWVWGWDSV